jgi:hypothetical protein
MSFENVGNVFGLSTIGNTYAGRGLVNQIGFTGRSQLDVAVDGTTIVINGDNKLQASGTVTLNLGAGLVYSGGLLSVIPNLSHVTGLGTITSLLSTNGLGGGAQANINWNNSSSIGRIDRLGDGTGWKYVIRTLAGTANLFSFNDTGYFNARSEVQILNGTSGGGNRHITLRAPDETLYISLGLDGALTGSNNGGANLAIWSYNDVGGFIRRILTFNRNSGRVTIDSSESPTNHTSGSFVSAGGAGFGGNVCIRAANSQLQIAPSTTGGPAEIQLYHRNDFTANVTTADRWVIGQKANGGSLNELDIAATTIGIVAKWNAAGLFKSYFGGDFNNAKLINLATPTAGTDAATKDYVDSVAASGLSPKEAVRVASVADVDINVMPAAIDDITLTNGDRVLLKNQTFPIGNGYYVFNGAGNVATRTTDMAAAAEVSGYLAFVSQGTVNGLSSWVVSNPTATDTVGTDDLIFVKFSSSTGYSFSTGLTLTGSVVTVNTAQPQVTSVGTLTGLDVNNYRITTTAGDTLGDFNLKNSSTNVNVLRHYGTGNVSGGKPSTIEGKTTVIDAPLTIAGYGAAARMYINEGIGTNRYILGAIQGDTAGDFHIWDDVNGRRIIGYNKSANGLKIGTASSPSIVIGPINNIIRSSSAAYNCVHFFTGNTGRIIMDATRRWILGNGKIGETLGGFVYYRAPAFQTDNTRFTDTNWNTAGFFQLPSIGVYRVTVRLSHDPAPSGGNTTAHLQLFNWATTPIAGDGKALDNPYVTETGNDVFWNPLTLLQLDSCKATYEINTHLTYPVGGEFSNRWGLAIKMYNQGNPGYVVGGMGVDIYINAVEFFGDSTI